MKEIRGDGGNQFTAGSRVIVARHIAVVAVLQFQVQMQTQYVHSFRPWSA